MLKNISQRVLQKSWRRKIAPDPSPTAAAVTSMVNLSKEDSINATSKKEKDTNLQRKMQECARSGNIIEALQFLDLMSPFCILDYNALLYGYIKSGHASVDHLRILFDSIRMYGLHSNVWTFNIILNGLDRLGHAESSLWFLMEMCRQHYVPSFRSLSRLMKKSTKSNTLDTSLILLDLMLRFRYFPSESVLRSLISSLSRAGRVAKAHAVFSLLMEKFFPSPYSYNPILFSLCKSALVLGFCQKKLWMDAYQMLENMEKDGFKPCTVTYTIIVKSLCDDGKVYEAMRVHDMMNERGCDADLMMYNVLIHGLCYKNMVSEVCELLREASGRGLSPDSFSLSAVSGGLLRRGRVRQAQAFLLEAFDRGFAADVVTWNIYLHCLCRDRRSREAAALLQRKMSEGFVPTAVTYNTILSGYCREKNVDGALLLLDMFKWAGNGPDSVSFNTVLSAACKQGDSSMVRKVLCRMDSAGFCLDKATVYWVYHYFCKVGRLSD